MRSEEPRVRVLVVDSHDDNVEVLFRQLRRHGYAEVTTAATAGDALALLGPVEPDAVLVDLGLPLLDGRSLLHHVRRSTRWSALPVLLLTGRQPASAIKAAAQEGASGFIHRPFDGFEIIFKIEQAVRGSGARAAELTDLARDGGPPAP
jgi:two-component system KDP operon response regulator KdpE